MPSPKTPSKIAYLNSHYSAISHTFIHREVKELLRQGFELSIFSVRPSKEGFVILRSPLRVIIDFLLFFISSPFQSLRGLFVAITLSSGGLKSLLWSFAYWVEAVCFLRELRNQDIFHAHIHMANNAATIALIVKSMDSNFTYSLSIHGPAEFNQVREGRLKQKVEGALFVRCISHYCRSQIMAFVDESHWQKLHLVHCGIELQPLSVKIYSGSEPSFLFVGRMVPEKGPLLLLETLREISATGTLFKLVMIGDGPIFDKVQNFVRTHFKDGRVQILGAQDPTKVAIAMDECDALVLPSFQEGVPVVLMEAMAKGKIVLSTQIAGIPELIENNKEGLLVAPGSEEALKGALFRVMRDKENLATLTKAAREKVHSEFNLQVETTKLAKLFVNYRVVGGSYNFRSEDAKQSA